MYQIKLPVQYLLKRKISYLAIASFALCVFIVIVVMTVHSGLVREFKEKNHNFFSDCIISSNSMVGFGYYQQIIDEIKKEPYVKAAAPMIISIGSLTRKNYDENIGVEIRGIDIERQIKVSNFAKTLYYHRNNPKQAFVPSYNPEALGFIPATAMMGSRDRYGKYAHPIDPVQLQVQISCVPLTARGAMQKADTDFVNTKTFYYSDSSESNIASVDSHTVYLAFDQAQLLCGMAGAVKRTNAVFIKFNDGVNIPEATEKTRAVFNKIRADLIESKKTNASLLNNVTVQSWKQYRRETIAWMEKEQIMLTSLFILVAITTVFIVFVIFYMIINHKVRDIGIMKSLGVPSKTIHNIFMAFAAMIALIGACIGTVAGWLFLLAINDIENLTMKWFGFQVFDRSVFAIGKLPNQIPPILIFYVFTGAVIASIMGAFIPAFKAARRKPVDSLRQNPL